MLLHPLNGHNDNDKWNVRNSNCSNVHNIEKSMKILNDKTNANIACNMGVLSM